jgi:site-specific recombinase
MVTVRVEFVLVDLAAQRIAVNAEDLRGARLVAVGTVQHALDETLFKLADSFVKENSPFHHLIDEAFQLIFHDGTLRSRTTV